MEIPGKAGEPGKFDHGGISPQFPRISPVGLGEFPRPEKVPFSRAKRGFREFPRFPRSKTGTPLT